MLSLTARLMVALSVVLAAFLSLTGYALDSAFQESARNAVRDRLQGHALTLVASTDISSKSGIVVETPIPVTRLNQRDSGLYARLLTDGRSVWTSPSLGAISLPPAETLARTDLAFGLDESSGKDPLFVLSYGVSWDVPDASHVYTMQVAENLESYNHEIAGFRRQLFGWLMTIAVALLAVQGLVMRWSLAPLRKAAQEIKSIESGAQEKILGVYPRELRALTDNINGFIQASRERLERYRNSLSDLAHSLKTPLALMRGAAESGEQKNLGAVVNDQVSRMGAIVDYQLQRAATSGRTPLARAVAVDVIANKIKSTLDKVYADKSVICEIRIAKSAVFHGDDSDIYELLGNLMDNAYKWCQRRVCITASVDGNARFNLIVEDDGPGVDPDLAGRVFERGIRSESKGGSGIGLAVVQDIVIAYGGSLADGVSQLGGASFNVSLLQ